MMSSNLPAVPIAALLVGLACGAPNQESPPVETPTVGPESQTEAPDIGLDESTSPGFVVRAVAVPPRESQTPDDELVMAARDLMTDEGHERACGPYTMYTDVEDEALLTTCEHLTSSLDATYTRRYGLTPLGQPAEAIFLFTSLDQYRSFVRQQTRMPIGYAAHADAGRGYLALYTGDRSRQDIVETLIHELTHLINRRALGGNLPPWLSEGLADGIGDTATEKGLQQIDGANGAEAQASRLKMGYAAGQVPSITRLIEKDSGEFDAGTVSYDYEQSAFLVRLLLTDPELARGFQAFLQALASGSVYAPGLFYKHMGLEALELDQRLEAWVRSTA
ncbi:MAG: hypothetical protein WBH75_01555 [Thermoanaerobaculia bacterium]